ncbi:MAG TPA: 3-hydroxyacyl-CoA dehydrogenase NAD-binding domain-containing protein [Steroidobacteraceae bacterium]|nr:3-hydroxyacyl-CoA dehydrogenase NAD-binding domain-containing protein [Steroidobacteraceae bacterium]
MTDGQVRCRSEEGIAIVEIDNPPVNALAQPVRAAFLDAIVAAEADPKVRAIVIHGVGRFFVAGADIREFDAPPRTPLLNDALLRLEASNKPVIAALHGAALGGGLELALASHYRCATADVSLGLPEVKLGLLPGSGGTQRLPRLVGPIVALEMMLTGNPIDAARAKALGIIDRLLEGPDALAGAVRYAHELVVEAAPPRRLRERSVDRTGADSDFFAAQRTRVAKESPGLLAPAYIIECVEAALSQPFEAALALSRRRFEECRTSVASQSLRHLFFAERPGAPAAPQPAARTVKRVAVIGAGTMGAGIAISLAMSGHDVTLIDPQPAALEAGLKRLVSTIEASAAKGRITAADAGAAIARVAGAGDLAAAADADLVIEAVFESMAVKQEVFSALDRACRPGAVLATNTSTLDVDAIGSATARPESVVGMHFFSPANIMRLVEVVKGPATGPEAIATALAVTRRMGKLGIVVGNCFGFVGNRMLYAYGRENQLLLLEGASPAEIDAALKAFGMAMGPNAVGDLAGLDIGYRVRRERKDLPGDPRYFRIADILVEAGRLGQKTGRGAFRYAAGSREPLPDPEVDALIAAEATRLGITRRRIADEEIVGRCIYALINEGARLLGEGIAASAADIDAIWCNGYGFPRLRGGPMFYADTLGLGVVLQGIERYAREQGPRDWTPAPLLAELAQRGSTFAEWDRSGAAAQRPGGAGP